MDQRKPSDRRGGSACAGGMLGIIRCMLAAGTVVLACGGVGRRGAGDQRPSTHAPMKQEAPAFRRGVVHICCIFAGGLNFN